MLRKRPPWLASSPSHDTTNAPWLCCCESLRKKPSIALTQWRSRVSRRFCWPCRIWNRLSCHYQRPIATLGHGSTTSFTAPWNRPPPANSTASCRCLGLTVRAPLLELPSGLLFGGPFFSALVCPSTELRLTGSGEGARLEGEKNAKKGATWPNGSVLVVAGGRFFWADAALRVWYMYVM